MAADIADDSGSTEYWRDIKRWRQEKRAINREESRKLLERGGIPHTVHNDGAHLIVSLNNYTVDFWPGTGKWIIRGVGRSGRGVLNMLDAIK